MRGGSPTARPRRTWFLDIRFAAEMLATHYMRPPKPVRCALLLFALTVSACGSCSESVEEEAESLVAPAPTGQVRPPCDSDGDCVVVDVACGGRSAEHRDIANDVEDYYARNSGSCRQEHQPALAAYCLNKQCSLDEVPWPGVRECARAEDCTYMNTACFGRLAVHKDQLDEANTQVNTPERVKRCAQEGETPQGTGWLTEALGDNADGAPSAPVCHRGYCR